MKSISMKSMSIQFNLKNIVMLMLFLHHTSAFCGWKEVASDQVATEFVNVETAQRFGIFVQMWSMSDYKVPQEVGNGRLYKSSKTLQEYDCEHHKKRYFNMIHYVENMGLGQVAFLDRTLGAWREVKVGSLGDAQLSLACKQP